MMPEAQAVLLRRWASGTSFVLDSDKSLKAEFARLAQVKGWIGGDAAWRTHWEACFGEVYAFGLHVNKAAPEIKSVSQRQRKEENKYLLTTEFLEDRMSHLSVGSDMSDFSVISAAPSVRSLDSDGLLSGGVDVSGGQEPYDNENRDVPQAGVTSPPTVEISLTDTTPKSKKSKKKKNKSKTQPEAESQTTQITLPDRTRQPTTQPQPPSPPSPTPQECSPFWTQFPGFVPRPTAPFKEEFARLAQHQHLTKQAKRVTQIEALNAEVAFHYGTCLHKLDRWQQLCEEMGIEEIPTSITQCKKELKSVRVNLFNLIDHRRNPQVKVKKFATYKQFAQSVKDNMFPKACAKQDGFIRVLLKKL